MLDWELRDPWFLLLAVLAPLVFAVASRSASVLTYSSLTLMQGTPKSLRQRMSLLPPAMMALAVVSLSVALARPRTPQHDTRISRDGIAIMMVVDLSSSMDARDLVESDRNINRLDVVKDVFTDFVFGVDGKAGQGRPDDLVGLVTFAGYADSVCPLTLDHGNLGSIVKDLEIVPIRSEDGTALGDGLALAVERLRRSTAKSRVAILLTDGVANAGAIDPQRAADLAANHDIKVYSIGAGTDGMAPFPGRDLFGRTGLIRQRVNIDEETLKQIAARTGGRYFRAVNREALADVYQEIDTLERTKVSEIRYLQYSEHYGSFVVAGMSLISLAMLLSASLLRKLP